MRIWLVAILCLSHAISGETVSAEKISQPDIAAVVSGIEGIWGETHRVERKQTDGEWREYDLYSAFTKHVSAISSTQILVDREHGPAVMKVDLGQDPVEILLLKADGEVGTEIAAKLVRLDLIGESDWSPTLQLSVHGRDYWFECLMSGNAFVYPIWEELDGGERKYNRIQTYDRLAD